MLLFCITGEQSIPKKGSIFFEDLLPYTIWETYITWR
jgi:hypothetical protein